MKGRRSLVIGHWVAATRLFSRLKIKAVKSHPTLFTFHYSLFTPKMSRGFGLIQALLILLVMAGIMTVAMRYASIGAKHTADSYNREEAELFMRSAIEITLLEISGYDHGDGSCLQHVRVLSHGHKYVADINITRYYVDAGAPASQDLHDCPVRYEIDAPESHGMVMMEAVVESNNSNPRIEHPVRLLYRGLQRP